MMEYYEQLENRKYLYMNKKQIPDSWYITKSGFLYNTLSNEHNLATLKNELDVIEFYIKNNMNLAELLINMNEINCSYSKDENSKLLLNGYLKAREDMYKSFIRLQNLVIEPYEEYKKLILLTNNNLSDILVRFVGFYKVESKVKKTITTSLKNYERELFDYILLGWNIEYVPSIIIDENNEINIYRNETLKIKTYMK